MIPEVIAALVLLASYIHPALIQMWLWKFQRLKWKFSSGFDPPFYPTHQ